MKTPHHYHSNTLRSHGLAGVKLLLPVLGAVVLLSASNQASAQPGGSAQRAEDAAFEKAPLGGNDYETKVLKILEGILENQRFRNVPLHDGRLLRILAESMNARHIVEMGTSTGYSGIWFGLALKKTGGKLTTYEIDADRAKVARENFAKAGMADIITLVEGDAHKEVTKLTKKIDILFLDADKEGYIDYLDKTLHLVRPGGMIIAHNINRRMADPKFIEAITTNPNLETVVRGGVSFTLKKR